jgi:hypothetical protein
VNVAQDFSPGTALRLNRLVREKDVKELKLALLGTSRDFISPFKAEIM